MLVPNVEHQINPTHSRRCRLPGVPECFQPKYISSDDPSEGSLDSGDMPLPVDTFCRRYAFPSTVNVGRIPRRNQLVGVRGRRERRVVVGEHDGEDSGAEWTKDEDKGEVQSEADVQCRMRSAARAADRRA
jgi:hypothetical protein